MEKPVKVTFRCKRSGNTVSFENEDDIKGLRQHEGYEEVKDVADLHADTPSFLQPLVEPPRRGRRKKSEQ